MSCSSQSWKTTDLSHKVALVTGANTGIGYETALGLAQLGARVLLHGRSKEKLDDALSRIRQASPQAKVEGLVADLSDMSQVLQLAKQVSEKTEKIDILVNNAGIILDKRIPTPDGFESTFAINHLAPFLLTQKLLPLLEAAAPARVVTVSSDWHRATRGLDFDNLQHESGYEGKLVYQRSKLANIYFARILANKLKDKKINSNSLHPGVVRSRFGQDGDMGGALAFFFKLARPFFITPEAGARTSMHLAASPEVIEITGKYFSKCKVVSPSPAGQDDSAAERLWSISEALLERFLKAS
ncbi:MAG: SDR family oxidoreductase [Myxococcota bacterium]|jgi:NAD(P)-dependent dehydrogenase (short-subunit alcohol dehydrogenase family)|nr:SDR family oxidoreductase [Myxococcota bacterium]